VRIPLGIRTSGHPAEALHRFLRMPEGRSDHPQEVPSRNVLARFLNALLSPSWALHEPADARGQGKCGAAGQCPDSLVLGPEEREPDPRRSALEGGPPLCRGPWRAQAPIGSGPRSRPAQTGRSPPSRGISAPPAGVEVSTSSLRETKLARQRRRCSRVSTSCFTERAARSNRWTMTTSGRC
jgi:hypothetical protein